MVRGTRRVLATSLLAVATLALPGAAHVAPDVGSDWAFAGPGVGGQLGSWNVYQTKKIRLRSNPSSSMSPDRCMDAFLDWDTNPTSGPNHYDGRFVRSCLPGMDEETDPGGDFWWEEPAGFDGAGVSGTQRGYGYYMDDDYNQAVADAFVIYDDDEFATAGNNPPPVAPRTGVDGWARIRTRYNNGTASSCNPTPVREFDFQGCN